MQLCIVEEQYIKQIGIRAIWHLDIGWAMSKLFRRLSQKFLSDPMFHVLLNTLVIKLVVK